MHGALKLNLANSFVQGKDEYPTTIADCMQLLDSWEDPLKKGTGTPRQQQWAEDAEGVSFSQHGFVDERQEKEDEGVIQASELGKPASNSLVSRTGQRK